MDADDAMAGPVPHDGQAARGRKAEPSSDGGASGADASGDGGDGEEPATST